MVGPSCRERGHGRRLRLGDPAVATDRRGQCRVEPLARRDQNRTERHRRGMGQEHDGCRNPGGWSRQPARGAHRSSARGGRPAVRARARRVTPRVPPVRSEALTIAPIPAASTTSSAAVPPVGNPPEAMPCAVTASNAVNAGDDQATEPGGAALAAGHREELRARRGGPSGRRRCRRAGPRSQRAPPGGGSPACARRR